jgi:hypothetical protein
MKRCKERENSTGGKLFMTKEICMVRNGCDSQLPSGILRNVDNDQVGIV